MVCGESAGGALCNSRAGFRFVDLNFLLKRFRRERDSIPTNVLAVALADDSDAQCLRGRFRPRGP